MKRLTYMLFLLFSATTLSGQDYFVGYEYWFDCDYQNVVESNVSEGEITLSVDVSHLEQGMHTFCFRLKDKQNRYSAPLARYFLRAGLDDGDASSVGCEYWLNDDYANRKTTFGNSGIINFEADVAALPQGIHALNYRLANASGGTGTCHTYPFLRAILDDGDASSVGCEYWLNDDYANRKTTFGNSGIINFEADVAALPQGVHTLNYRLANASGGTGICHTYPFLRVELDETDIAKLRCEYWLDDDFENRRSVPIGANGIADFDAEISAKLPGIHSLNYRLTDAQGNAGAIATHMFLHTHLGQANPAAWECEYWFDTDYAGARVAPVNADSTANFNADVDALSRGVHFLNYRFRDAEGHTSITSAQCFLRVASDSLEAGRLEYEYWFDHDYGNRQTGTCYSQLVELDVNTAALSGGIHCFNFRTRDNDESYCPTVTQYFIHSAYNPEDNKVAQYCYWFDDGRPDTVDIDPVNPLEWTDRWIDVPELPLPETLPEDDISLARYYPEGITEPSDADKVWLKLSIKQECAFHLCFNTNAGIWTEDEPSYFTYENSRLLVAAPLPVNRVSRITRQPETGVQAHYIAATAGTLCLRSDQPCRLTVFSEDGKCFAVLEPEELMAGVRIEIPQTGRYYTLLDKIVKEDITYPQAQLKLVCVTDPLPDVINVEEAGTLPDLLSFTQNKEVKQLTLAGSLNGTDIRLLRDLSALAKLNLSDVAITQGGEAYDEAHRTDDYTIGDRMFYGLENLTELALPLSTVALGERALYGCTNLQEVTIPASVRQVGKEALGGMGGSLLVVHWLAVDAPVTVEAFDTPEEMANCLVYAPAGTEATYEGNIIIGSRADAIRLTDAKPFRCPEAFKTKEVTYVRHFSLPSGNNGQAGGWESIVLPFDVAVFRSEERGELAPFDSGKEGVRPFWLAELTREEGFRLTTKLHANKPYIISMPNSDDYEEEFNIRGNVVFYAGDEAGVDVLPTASVMREAGQRFALVPVYETVLQHDTVYAVNRTPYANQLAGGAFVRNLRNVLPFEAYASSNAVPLLAPAYYGIGGDIAPTGVESLLRSNDDGLQVYSRNGIVYIKSERFRELGLYGSDGRMLRLLRIEKGKTELQDLPPGIYLVGRKKVTVIK